MFWRKKEPAERPFDLQSATDFTLAALQHHDPPSGALGQVVSKMKGAFAPEIYNYRMYFNKDRQVGTVGVYDRWIVYLRPSTPDAIQLSMNDSEAQRGQELTADIRSNAELNATIESWYDKIEWWRTRLSVYRLQPDHHYRVIQSFTDYYNGHFTAGDILTYIGQNFLPYEGGYTIKFKEASLYLQETQNALLLNAFDAYIEEI